MTKAELIERVYKNRGLPPTLTKKNVGQIVEAVFGELGEYFIRAKVPNNSRGKPKRPYPKFTWVRHLHQEEAGGAPGRGAAHQVADRHSCRHDHHLPARPGAEVGDELQVMTSAAEQGRRYP
jgi:hypothetical protein